MTAETLTEKPAEERLQRVWEAPASNMMLGQDAGMPHIRDLRQGEYWSRIMDGSEKYEFEPELASEFPDEDGKPKVAEHIVNHALNITWYVEVNGGMTLECVGGEVLVVYGGPSVTLVVRDGRHPRIEVRGWFTYAKADVLDHIGLLDAIVQQWETARGMA